MNGIRGFVTFAAATEAGSGRTVFGRGEASISKLKTGARSIGDGRDGPVRTFRYCQQLVVTTIGDWRHCRSGEDSVNGPRSSRRPADVRPRSEGNVRYAIRRPAGSL
jgi:hypothetical protein